jgi:hypothetical protein
MIKLNKYATITDAIIIAYYTPATFEVIGKIFKNPSPVG